MRSLFYNLNSKTNLYVICSYLFAAEIQFKIWDFGGSMKNVDMISGSIKHFGRVRLALSYCLRHTLSIFCLFYATYNPFNDSRFTLRNCRRWLFKYNSFKQVAKQSQHMNESLIIFWNFFTKIPVYGRKIFLWQKLIFNDDKIYMMILLRWCRWIRKMKSKWIINILCNYRFHTLV